MWVKICGTTNLKDALLAADAGADALGFVLTTSKRQVTPEQVAAIVSGMPAGAERVGVVGAEPVAWILEAARTAGLTGLQLHRRFEAGLVETLARGSGGALRLVQVVTLEAGGDAVGSTGDTAGVAGEDSARAESAERFVAELAGALAHPDVSAVLLDAAVAGRSGGLGVGFSAERAAPLIRRARELAGGIAGQAGGAPKPLLVAGGLHAGNVAGVIAALRPAGVDAVSGVEAAPGRKDPAKVRAFVTAARLAGDDAPR